MSDVTRWMGNYGYFYSVLNLLSWQQSITQSVCAVADCVQWYTVGWKIIDSYL